MLHEFYRCKGFASAEATKGRSDRPLETFGVHTPILLGYCCRTDLIRRSDG